MAVPRRKTPPRLTSAGAKRRPKAAPPVSASFARRSRDLKWFRENFPSLEERYPDEFVVVWNREVVGHGPTVERVWAAADAAGVPLREGVLEFVPSPDRSYMF